MSQPTAGNFDCARLQEIKVRVDSLVTPNDVKNAEYIPDIAPLQMVKEIQTAQFPDLEDPTKDNTVKAVWMDDCDSAEPDDCAEGCEIDGNEIGTVCKDYELTDCFEKSFSVSERKFRAMGNTVSFDEQVAISLAKKIKLMDEEWARRTVSAMDSMVGENLNTAPYTVSSTHTSIPPTAWNADLFSYFAVTKARNKMPNMRLVLGGLMEQQLLKIEQEAGTEMGAANARKVASLGKVYTDMFVTEELLGHKAAYLIAPSALAVVTKAYNTPYGAGREEIASGNKQIHYTITSPNSGIRYDVIYQVKCVSTSGAQDWVHTWMLRTKGAVLTSPVFCNADRTGVLKFRCV